MKGISDLGVFPVTGQPELIITIDRKASARYGLMASDVDAAVQAAIGGSAATQILDGDRRFDFVVRYEPQFRSSPEANQKYSSSDAGRQQCSDGAGGQR